MTNPLDLHLPVFLGGSAPHTSPPSSSSGTPSSWKSVLEEALHDLVSAPFVYQPSPQALAAFPLLGQLFDHPAPSGGSSSQQGRFEDWINTLAHWTQAGSATIGQHHNQSESWSLAADGSDHATRGGWNSSS